MQSTLLHKDVINTACNDNDPAAARAYAEKFPNRRHPNKVRSNIMENK